MKDEAVPRGGCLSWWRSVGEDKSKALKSLFVSGVLFERAWVLSLYRGGVVVILLMSAMGNPSE